MARLETLEITALLEAIAAEQRTEERTEKGSRPRLRSTVGRVLTMAHQLGRGSAPLTDLAALKSSVLN